MPQPKNILDEYVKYITAAIPNVPYSRRFSQLVPKCRMLSMFAKTVECSGDVKIAIKKLLYNVCLRCKDWAEKDTIDILIRVPYEMKNLEQNVTVICHAAGISVEFEALRQDEEQDLELLVRRTMSVLSHQTFQDECLALETHEAEYMMKIMHKILVQSAPDNPDRTHAFHILTALSDKCNSCITVATVKLDGDEEYFTSTFTASISTAAHNGGRVAVKRIRILSGQDASLGDRGLRRQIHLWNLITQQHQPHILPLIGITDSQFPPMKMVSPWQENSSLSDYIKRPVAAEVNRLRLLQKVCSALQFLHNHVPVVIHANLKCANVLINRHGDPYLAGFSQATVDGTIPGDSVRWMAPELFAVGIDDLDNDEPKATRYSDIWSFAMLVLELLTEELPFADKLLESSVVCALLEGEHPNCPRSSKAFIHGLNNKLWLYLRNCWRFSPRDRLPLQHLFNLVDTLATQWRPPGLIWQTQPLSAPTIVHIIAKGGETREVLQIDTNVTVPAPEKSGDNHALEITGSAQDIQEGIKTLPGRNPLSELAQLQKQEEERWEKAGVEQVDMKVKKAAKETTHNQLQEGERLQQEVAERMCDVEEELNMAVKRAENAQKEGEHVKRANSCFDGLQQCNPVSHQTHPIEWIRCNNQHVMNLAQDLSSHEASIGNIYPRFIVYTLACMSVNLPKLSSLLKVLESWKIWDDVSALANHQIIKNHLMACLRSMNTMHGTEYHNSTILAHVLGIDAIAIDALLLATLRDRAKYKQLVKRRGREAQSLLNLLQARLGFPLDSSLKRFHLEALIRLSRSSGLYPECMILKGINIGVVGTTAIDFGGYGDIWKGLLGGKEIAIKILRILRKSEKHKFLKDFSSEAVIWRQLDHPNVLPFYGVFHLEDDRLCLASPWMHNGNVVRFLESAPETECVPLMLDIAEGLSYLHDFKPSIIHGDIKGVNILITQFGRACLGDFGLAAAKGSQSMAVTTAVITRAAGTLRWQAPELLGDDDVCNSSASDVYAYACVCYELFSGKWPFHDIQKDWGVMRAVMQGGRPLRPSDDRCRIRGLNDEIWSILETCWAQEPDQRLSADRIVGHLRSLSASTDERLRDEFDPMFPCRTLYSQAEHPFSALASMADEQLA